MRLKLRPGWRAAFERDCLEIQSDVRKFRVQCSVDRFPVGFAAALRTGIDRDNQPSAISSVLDRLLAEGFLHSPSESMNSSGLNAYLAHLCRDSGLDTIAEADISIFGVGGTGAVVLQHLVGAGAKNFILFDKDVVELANLERQFIFEPADVGRPKVEAAADYVCRRHPDGRVQALQRDIGTAEEVRIVCAHVAHAKIGIVCIDQPFEIAVRGIPQGLWDLGVPCLQGGVMIRSGFFGPLFDPAQTIQSPNDLWQSIGDSKGAEPETASFPPNNTIIAALIAAQVIHHLIGAHALVNYQQRTYIDLFRGRGFAMGTGGNLP